MTALAKILIITNPISGNGASREVLDGLIHEHPAATTLAKQLNAGQPQQWSVLETTQDGSWKTQLQAYLKSVSTLVVIGGDGTLMDVASELVTHGDHATRLVALPSGRGNDFVRGLYGYSKHESKSGFWDWARQKQWEMRDLDLASVNGKIFVNMASIGYGGKVVEKSHNRNAFWSKTSAVYQVEGALALLGEPETQCEVKAGGSTIYRGRFFGAFLANGRSNGSGLFWTPAADYGDGKLDGIIFAKPSVSEMLRTLSSIKKRGEPVFSYKRCRAAEITFQFDSPAALELDGDYVGSERSYGFKCLPRALSAWVIKN